MEGLEEATVGETDLVLSAFEGVSIRPLEYFTVKARREDQPIKSTFYAYMFHVKEWISCVEMDR